MLLHALANGTNLVANVTLPNRSVMTLEVVSLRQGLSPSDLTDYDMFRAKRFLISRAAISTSATLQLII
jgi:hypothetical protein